jgi:hypothetical protein
VAEVPEIYIVVNQQVYDTHLSRDIQEIDVAVYAITRNMAQLAVAEETVLNRIAPRTRTWNLQLVNEDKNSNEPQGCCT